MPSVERTEQSLRIDKFPKRAVLPVHGQDRSIVVGALSLEGVTLDALQKRFLRTDRNTELHPHPLRAKLEAFVARRDAIASEIVSKYGSFQLTEPNALGTKQI